MEEGKVCRDRLIVKHWAFHIQDIIQATDNLLNAHLKIYVLLVSIYILEYIPVLKVDCRF